MPIRGGIRSVCSAIDPCFAIENRAEKKRRPHAFRAPRVDATSPEIAIVFESAPREGERAATH
jgi:hypothetical protein